MSAPLAAAVQELGRRELGVTGPQLPVGLSSGLATALCVLFPFLELQRDRRGVR